MTLQDVGLDDEHAEQLKMVVPFTDQELHALALRFLQLDEDKSGSISWRELFRMPEFNNHPLRHRLQSVLMCKDELTFSDFVRNLSVFSDLGTKAEKIRFLFQMYDMDGDGLLSTEDVTIALELMLGDSPAQKHVPQLVKLSFSEADSDEDGFLSIRDFTEVVGRTDAISTRVRIKL